MISWPKKEWGFDPPGLPRCDRAPTTSTPAARHGRQRHHRVDVLPDVRFSAGHFRHVKDETTGAVIRACNDWHIEDWCGAYPDRFIPLSIVPSWDRAETVAEIGKRRRQGSEAITLPELPHLDGLPSYHDMDHWGPIFEAIIDNGLVMCLHIGQGFAALQLAPDGPIDNLMIMACQISMLGAQDLLWGPAFRAYPELKVAFSEGGIGWIPFYLDRCDRHFTNQEWLHDATDFGGKLPSEVFREHAGVLRHRPDVARTTQQDRDRSDRVGVRLPPLGLDVAGRTRTDAARAEQRRRHRRGDREDLLAGTCRFFDWDPFAGGTRRSHRGRLAGRSTDVDTSTTTRAEYAEALLTHSAS